MDENIENRTQTVAVRLSVLQMNRLKKAAREKGLPPSTFAYLAVLQLTNEALQSDLFDQKELSIL